MLEGKPEYRLAKPEHLDHLSRGVDHWNRWRRDHPDIEPDLSRATLNAQSFAGSSLVQGLPEGQPLNLRGIDFSGADLQQARISDTDLADADLRKANLRRAKLQGVTARRADCSMATLSNSLAKRLDLQDANFSGAVLHELECNDSTFAEADFTGANLVNSRFPGCVLRNATLSKAAATRTNFRGADLSEAVLVKTDLREADFSNARMEHVRLDEADMEAANLTGVMLLSASMRGVNLRGAELANADLRRARLTGANLRASRLVRTDLRGADLRNTNVAQVTYSRWSRYRGIRLGGAYGSPQFVRYALDQEFIEEVRGTGSGPRYWLLYLPWLVSSDCGRSLGLWAGWSVLFALLYGIKFWSMGPGHFAIVHLEYSFATMLYYSVITFTTLGFGDVIPTTPEAALWVVAEVVTGYVMLGGLVAIFSNKLARRS